jgi:PAS domain S-box-containing protein
VSSAPAFLSGGGEMGALIRAHPWSATPLGPPERWSQALRIVVRLMLNTRQPTLIFWGAEAICFHNDAAGATLGAERHPAALGRPAREVWGEIWPLVGPQIEQVMAGNGGTFHENEALAVTKNDRPHEAYWTYSFSPIDDEDANRVGGVLVLCSETTDQVIAARRLARENEQRYAFFDRLPAFVGILRGPDHVYEYVNASYEAFVGRDDLIGHTVRDRFPELEGQGFFEMLDGVFASGDPVILQAVPIRFTGDTPDQFMDFRYDPIFDAGGAIDGIFVSGHDLTERVQAETRRQVLAELSERLRDLKTPSDIAFVASELLGRTMQVSRAGYGTVDRGTEMLRVDRDWNAPGIVPLPAIVHLREYGSYIDDLKDGAAVAIADVAHDARTAASADALQARSARAFVDVPVIEEGELVAMLYLNHAEVRSWSDEDMAFVREFAERTRTAVERARSDAALHRLTQSLEHQVEQRTQERDRLWETSEDLLAIVDYDGTLVRISPSWTRHLGHDEQALLSDSSLRFVHADDVADVVDRLARMRASGQPVRFECRLVVKDGGWRWIAWLLVPEADARRFTAVGRDVTADREAGHARALLEEQLRQAQKMEAVGQLTGGIAHDFNNMILGITGSLQIAGRRLAQGRADEIGPFIARAKTAADRAAALTHRLLAFSRRQPLDPHTVDANALIASLEDLFRRTIGERIALHLVQAERLWMTLCDPNQLESSLLNLVLNARDAMPEGGTLTIETCNADLDATDVSEQPDVEPGAYVCICVRDTGIGMSADTMAKAFDPFFTTKSIGRGTGLGLSMIYGFARQSKGFARLHSTLGQGARVDVYLPRHIGRVPAVPPRVVAARTVRTGHGETILVIEDDALVRSLVVDELSEHGYRVLQVPDGTSGLALLHADIRIDLLVTDIGLPDIDGRQIAEAARGRRPGLKILFMTGYAENAAAAAGFLITGMQLIAKPFDVEDISTRVRAMIDG